MRRSNVYIVCGLAAILAGAVAAYAAAAWAMGQLNGAL